MYVYIHNFFCSQFFYCCFATFSGDFFFSKRKKGLGRQWLVHLPRRCLHGFGGFNLGGSLLLPVKVTAAGRKPHASCGSREKTARVSTGHQRATWNPMRKTEKHFLFENDNKQQNQCENKSQMTRRNWAANVVFSALQASTSCAAKNPNQLGLFEAICPVATFACLAFGAEGGKMGKEVPLGHRRSWLQMMHQ